VVAPSTEERLVLKRELAASPDVVFDAWTQPEHMQHWFGPTPEFKLPIREVDLQVGGKYRIGFESPDGAMHIVGGEFSVVEKPNKLVYTWEWEEPGEHAGCETLITIDFNAIEAGTELVLTQERFGSTEMRDSHNMGWSGAIDQLVPYIANLNS
jgi:uncharacterized protein YndB with AHSA1/START domain